MKPLAISFAAALALLLPLAGAHGQTSAYNINFANVDYSGMNANGGTILLPFELTSGPALPGVGSSFNITLTVSPITSYVLGNTYTWPDADQPPFPGYTYAGGGYPDEIYTNPPPSNQNALDMTIGPITLTDGVNTRIWWEAQIAANNAAFLGAFTLSLSGGPTLPDDYVMTVNELFFGHGYQYFFEGDEVYAGVWSTMGPPMNDADENFASRWVNFGDSLTYQFLAVNSTGVPPEISDFFPMWNLIYGGAEFEAVPEPSSVAFLLVAGGFTLAAMRRRRSAR